MILLLSTPLAIYSYDLISGELKMLATGKSEYFGIAWNEKEIFLSHSNINNASLVSEKDYRNSDKGYIKTYSDREHSIVSYGLSMPHQILIDSKDRLLATNTGLNCITVTDIAKKKQFALKLNEIDCDVINGEKVGNHFNSLYEHENRLYIGAHNHARKSAVWELDINSLNTIKIYNTEANFMHNIWICEHGMIICDSRNGSLYEVFSGETIWKADESSVLTRGIAANKKYIFVGRTEFGNRLTRKWSDGGFWVLDRKTLKTIDMVKISKTGCVNDLRLFGTEDHCHTAPVLSKDKLKYILDIPIFNKLRRNYKYINYKIKDAMQNVNKSLK